MSVPSTHSPRLGRYTSRFQPSTSRAMARNETSAGPWVEARYDFVLQRQA